MKTTAVISPDGIYRYHLRRVWDATLKRVAWIMLNPSTADANEDDPTIRRCIDFTKAWGYGGIDVVNLFALRATKPDVIKTHSDPIGMLNDEWILKITSNSEIDHIIAAWGRRGAFKGRDQQVIKNLEHHSLSMIGKAEFPRHPLYLKGDLKPVRIRNK